MKTVLNIKNVDLLAQPMFLGEDLGIQRYDQTKYKKFDDLYWQQAEQFWLPTEVSLIKDKADYKNLTKEEQFVFEKNIKWQTMTDSMLSRSIHQITKYVSNTELESCCNLWAAFEDIHSRSYTYIFKNVVNDAESFFDSILEDKEIIERAKEAKSAYDKLLGEPKDIKQEIFDSILATQITEGLSFYISFACSFFFGYKGKMEGNAKIISLIARDERLHVAITQNILSNWRDIKEEGFQGIIKQNEQKIYDMYGLSVEIEKKWAKYLFSEGYLLGLNNEILSAYIEWLANSRLTSLGYKKLFEQKTNPLSGWLESYNDSSKSQVAPQESELSSYKIGARNTEINSNEFNNIIL